MLLKLSYAKWRHFCVGLNGLIETNFIWLEIQIFSSQRWIGNVKYHQSSDISHTFVGNNIVNHSDVAGASPVGARSNYIFVLDLAPGFNGLGKNNCTTRREAFEFLGFGATCAWRVWRYPASICCKKTVICVACKLFAKISNNLRRETPWINVD